MTDNELYLGLRQAVLSALDVFERWLIVRGILRASARTAEQRKELREVRIMLAEMEQATRKECDEQA